MADFQTFLPVLKILWEFLKVWWWVFPPFLLFGQFIFFWTFWREEYYDSKEPKILLEFKFPQNVEKPIKAMESVFGGFWQIYDPPNPREYWFEGQYQGSLNIELVSTEGEVHFYLRVGKSSRQIVDSALYSQFPDAEFIEVDDYKKKVPQNVPNKDWKMWGATMRLAKPDPYPIRTYQYFEPNPDSPKEEKRIDPMTIIVEGLAQLGKGEHMWIEFVCTPFGMADKEGPKFVEEGQAVVNELVHRSNGEGGKSPTITIMEDLRAAGHMAATGEDSERRLTGGEKEETGLLAPELRLTPGERDIVAGIEEKITKPTFNVVLRFIYLARIENYFGPAKALPFSYFNQFSHGTMNLIKPEETVKVHTVSVFPFDKRRGYLRRRRLFRMIQMGFPTFFPSSRGTMKLNIEEMASLFHFPGRMVYPSATISRVEAKKGEAPAELPLE